jgi:hypothetical protein
MLNFWIVPEINEESDACSRGAEIVHKLGAVTIVDGFGCLDFQNHLAVTEEIRFIFFPKLPALVFQFKRRLHNKWNISDLEFNLQTLLINVFQKPAALLPINFETSAKNLIGLRFKDQCHFSSFPCIPSIPWFAPILLQERSRLGIRHSEALGGTEQADEALAFLSFGGADEFA